TARALEEPAAAPGRGPTSVPFPPPRCGFRDPGAAAGSASSRLQVDGGLFCSPADVPGPPRLLGARITRGDVHRPVVGRDRAPEAFRDPGVTDHLDPGQPDGHASDAVGTVRADGGPLFLTVNSLEDDRPGRERPVAEPDDAAD